MNKDTLQMQTRRDAIVDSAWKIWTGYDAYDGEGHTIIGSAELRAETEKTVQDAVNNTYTDGISDIDWLAATLKRLE